MAATIELSSPSRTAQDLLLEFKATGRQEPFEEIVRRYAGMVFHVCLRVTRNNHDAEDATQAVFLTLAVQARADKEIRYIGPWLQQVAHRLSLDLRKSKKRREKREERHSVEAGGERVESESAQQMHFDELKSVINQEINKLPPKYRVPLIMHYFGGLSRDEMARELQCKPGTLGVRLHRAREMLGERLARRGVSMADGTMSLAVAYAVQSVVAEHIISNTCQAASNLFIGHASTGHLVPAHLVMMARGAVHAVLMAKVKTVAALLVAMGCAVAAGAEVVSKVTPLDLGLDLQLRIGDWVKEHLLPFSSPIQVNAIEDDAGAESPMAPVASRSTVGHGAVTFEGYPPDSTSSRPVMPLPTDSIVVGSGIAEGAIAAGDATALQFPGLASGDAPRRVSNPWDVGPRGAASGAPAWIPVRTYAGESPRSGHFTPSISAVPVLRSDRDRTRPPRLDGSTLSGPWRPQAPTIPHRGGRDRVDDDDDGGGAPPPTKPENPSTGGNGGKPSKPVQVAALNSNSVDLYLGPESALPTPNAPRSPAGLSLRRPGADAPLATGSYTNVNYGSISDAVFHVSPTTMRVAMNGSVLQADSAFSGTDWNATAQLDVFSSDAVYSSEHYTDRTFFRFDPLEEKLVVIGRRSSAKLTGVTIESTPARLAGWGTVGPADTFDQSGQVIADGLGQRRVLDLSDVGLIRNLTDNLGANGWYARNGGKLVLRELRVLPGTRTYTWGEDPADPQLDLVNSVRLRVRDAVTAGRIEIALASADRGDVPPLPTGERIVGLWQMDAAGVVADGADLTVRYDDGLIADLGLSESTTRLWAFGGGTWNPVREGFALDTTNNLVRGSVESATFFAVAVTPEPGTIGVMVGASFLLLRRRRS